MFANRIAICVGLIFLCALSSAFGHVRVRGYFHKDGTYVAPHYRSSPNSSKSDNYSARGNYNPYTGKIGTVPASQASISGYLAYDAAPVQPKPIYSPSLITARPLPQPENSVPFLCIDAEGGQHLIDYPRAGCDEAINIYAQNRLSDDAIKRCADVKVPECQHKYAEILEKKGDAAALRQARSLYQSAFELGYDPAGAALLRLLRQHTDAAAPSEMTSVPGVADETAKTEVATEKAGKLDPPVSAAKSGGTVNPTGVSDDAKGIAWPKTHGFKSCFSTHFTVQIKGRTFGKPSKWVSQFRSVSTTPTDEKYIFCFPERGVAGSAMYANGAWIYFQRNDFGQLHGDVERGAGNVTRFIYFQATGDAYSPVEGSSELYVALNADKAPEESVSFNVMVLQGRSTRIEIPD